MRRAFLCGDGFEHRKRWIEERLKMLAQVMAIDCAGFAIMDNHLHLLLRLDSRIAKTWDAREVARRWAVLFPPKKEKGQGQEALDAWIEQKSQEAGWVKKARGRLASLSWFMKCLKEPIARMANREDGCTGAFWEGRFRSVAVLDEESLLATCAYIDLNPVAAGMAKTPEESEHTSLAARLRVNDREVNDREVNDREVNDREVNDREVNDQVRMTNNQEEKGEVAMTDGNWLLPVEDCREQGGCCGLLGGFTMTHYLRLVDWTSRLVRDGKSRVDAEVASIFERLGFDAVRWQATMRSLFGEKKLVGCFLGRPESLMKAAGHLDRRWVKQRGTRAALPGG